MAETGSYSRVAKNTLILYARMLLTMGISFWTTRIVLEALGVDDYGIYNVLGGMVALCAVLTGSLQISISRYLTIELGRGNTERLQRIFSSSVWVMTALALLIGVVAEGFGQWFVRCEMSIQPGNIGPALWAMQCFIVSFMLQLVCAPYNSLLIAHERMGALAGFTVLNKIVALGIAYLALWSPANRLIVYAVAMMLLDVGMRIMYNVYCSRQFEECRLSFRFDRDLFKDMGAFTGWAFLGNAGYHISMQGTSMVLNVFCGLAVNAARGLATQVTGALDALVNNFMCAVNPQITKSWASGDHEYMQTLAIRAMKFGFFIMLLVGFPICLSLNFLLEKWLTEVPPYTYEFILLSIVYSLITCLSTPLLTITLAQGKIKKYEIQIFVLFSLAFILLSVMLKYGFSPLVAYILMIFTKVLILGCLLQNVKNKCQISIKFIFNKAIFPCLLVSIFLIVPIWLDYILGITSNWSELILKSLTVMAYICATIFIAGLTKSERKWITAIFQSNLNKLLLRA